MTSIENQKSEIKNEIVTVVLNWNGSDVIGPCLDSLLASRNVDMHVLVVDNASTDDSLQLIKQNYPDVSLIELEENTGFCIGNNIGMKWALEKGAEFVFLANNDIVADENAVAALVNTAREHPESGAVGGKVYYYDRPNVLQSAGAAFNRDLFEAQSRGKGEEDKGQFDRSEQVDINMGCALLLRSAALKQVGLLDERFQFYHEESDLCMRMAASGWSVWYTPESKVFHHSGFENPQRRICNVYYGTRNNLLIWSKHRPVSGIKVVRATLRSLREEYFIARADKFARPYLYVIAALIGIFDYFRKRFGAQPKIIDRLASEAKPK